METRAKGLARRLQLPTAADLPEPALGTWGRVADMLGTSERTARRLADAGHLRIVRIGSRCTRVDLRSVREFIASGGKAAAVVR